MTTNRWYQPLAALVLLLPIASAAQGPQPAIREIAKFPFQVGSAAWMPNGRIIIYSSANKLHAYDPVTTRSTLVAEGFDGEFSISRSGDRIAFSYFTSEAGNDFIWSVPIDPETGKPTGPAQRVSSEAGDTPNISPDGKLIAFARYTSKGNDLSVVPVTGGPERTLASFTSGVFFTSWSDDGRWVFADVGRNDSIQRIPAAGGHGETVIRYSGRGEGIQNGRVGLYRPDTRARDEGRISYVTLTGTRGRFSLPPGAGWPGDVIGGGNERVLVTSVTRPEWAHSISLTDGKLSELRPASLRSRGPAWSPDGKRIALQDSVGGSFGITVVNADGSQPRRYPVGTSSTFMRWSPDGKLLAYSPTPSPGGSLQLAVLDVATGTSRIVASIPINFDMDYTWRPDGKSIVIVKQRQPWRQNPLEVSEASLDGKEHSLRNIGAEFPGFGYLGLISDRFVLSGNLPGSVAAESVFVVPTGGGAARKLPRGTALRNGRPAVSPDGNSLVFLVRSGGRITSVELMRANGDSVRTLNLPFVVDSRMFSPPFHPDGRHVILFGKAAGDSVSKIFLVPLDGSTPRVLATLPTTSYVAGRLALSPDGKTAVFTSVGTSGASTVFEVDMTSILQTVKR